MKNDDLKPIIETFHKHAIETDIWVKEHPEYVDFNISKVLALMCEKIRYLEGWRD